MSWERVQRRGRRKGGKKNIQLNINNKMYFQQEAFFNSSGAKIVGFFFTINNREN